MEPKRAKTAEIDKKTQKLKKFILESALSTTIHGIPNIFRAERILLKIMWTLCLLGSSSYCFFSICKSFNSYFNREVVTNINIIKEKPTEFPAVTFCNLNPFVTDYALDQLKSFRNMIFSSSNNISTNLSTNANLSIDPRRLDTRRAFQEYTMSEALTDENRKNYSYPLEDVLLNCYFDSMPCTADDFYWFYDSVHGNCYTWNKGINSKGQNKEILNSSRAGELFGLNIEFFIGMPSKVDYFIQSTGIYVKVHNKSLQPVKEMGVKVSGGEETNIIIYRVFDTVLPDPYSNCLPSSNSIDAFNSEFYKAILLANQTYIQNECQKLCLNDELKRKCNCIKYIEPSVFNFTVCNMMDKCVQDVTKQFDFKQILRCFKLCPPECDTITYSLSTSHSDFPTPANAEYLMNLPNISKILKNNSINLNESLKIDYNEFKRSVVSIKVFYDDLKYTIVSQIPKMSLEDLISNFGGLLGLFVGASFLSLVEIIEVIFEGIFILWPKMRKTTKVQNFKN